MSHKQGQESQIGYTDGIKVKISEQYKPPRRINLVMNYAQRLSLNKQLQDNTSHYDFALENNIKHKLKEWQAARKEAQDERKLRLDKIKEARQKYEEKMSIEREKLKASEVEQEKYVAQIENCQDINNLRKNVISNMEQVQTFNNCTSTSGVLLPIQISSYSHILTPTPLSSSTQTFSCKPNDKSPFNISDFEADTSSPFDNMELKTLNDMEELAQVLQKDENVNINKTNTSYNIPQVYSNYSPSNVTHPQIYSGYIRHENTASNSQYAYLPQVPDNAVNSYMQSDTPIYQRTNGYYYTPEKLPDAQLYSASNYNQVKADDYFKTSPQELASQENKKTTFRSVPDIVKAVQAELDNTHIVNPIKADHQNHSKFISDLRRHVPDQSNNVGSKNVLSFNLINKSVNLEDPYCKLSKDLQRLSKTISSMGFPLPRVARVCQLIGNDQKKVVDHLLVMTELLDLGFSEKEISSALLQSNNDRDKALDILIS